MRFRESIWRTGESQTVEGRRETTKHRSTSVMGEGLRYDSSKYAIGLNRWLLSPLGVWPLSRNATGCEARGRRLRLVFSVALISGYMIPQYLYISKTPDPTEILDIVSPIIFDTLAMIKFVIFVLNDENFGYCVNFLRDDWNAVKLKNDKDTMMKNARFGRYVTICCFGCMYSGVTFQNICWPLIKLISDADEENSNVTERALPYPITYVYYDEKSTPIYEITLVVQFIGSFYICILNCGGYGLVGALVSHACGQLQIIGSQLEDLVDGNRREFHSTKLRMAAVVEHHSKVIRYVQCLRESLHVFFLTEELGAVTVICISGYRMLPVTSVCLLFVWIVFFSDLLRALGADFLILQYWNRYHSVLGMSIYLFIEMAVILSLFNVSIVGQRLMDESQKVGIAASRVQWYRLPPEISKGLVVCMVRAAHPLKLSACDMFDVCLANFSDVLRGSYVFLSLVRKVTDVE